MSTRDFPPLSGHITNDPDTLMRWLIKVNEALNIDDHVEVTSPSASDEVDIFNVASGKRRKLKLSNLPFTLGAITPTSVAASGTVTGSNLSGTNTGDLAIATPVASTSGTSIDFTGIPAGTKLITINFADVSTNGASNYLIQIGASGVIETSGYKSGVSNDGGVRGTSTAGYIVYSGVGAAFFFTGIVTLILVDATTNKWVASSVMGETGSGQSSWSAGTKSTSAVLDRVRITTVGGTDTFDSGAINIARE